MQVLSDLVRARGLVKVLSDLVQVQSGLMHVLVEQVNCVHHSRLVHE